MSEAISTNISPEFPFESKYVNVHGSNLHYVEQGEGDPILFIHGIPTSSYLWRNIIPPLSTQGRCIALDLMGTGKSDKPDIDYTVFDHIQYLEGFIEALDLKKLTLVMHAWGSVIGFSYARAHEDNIKALAFIEAHVRPAVDWEMVALPVQELASILDEPDGGYETIMNSNYFIDRVFPSSVLRSLSEEELSHYREPFLESSSHKPIWQFLQDLPLGRGPSPVIELIDTYSQWLQNTSIPKLMMYAVPGFNTTMATVQWAKEHLPNLQLSDIGDALHYAQESNPQKISQEIAAWYKKLS